MGHISMHACKYVHIMRDIRCRHTQEMILERREAWVDVNMVCAMMSVKNGVPIWISMFSESHYQSHGVANATAT